MEDEDTYEIPLQDQRVFGAGIKRKRVQFVPSTSTSSSTLESISNPASTSSAKSISDLYLRLVLPQDLPDTQDGAQDAQVCEVCKLPINSDSDAATSSSTSKVRPHEASLAHQDRNRKGLAYLSSYGWDPDARQGLGANGQGIQFPVKTKPKDDKLGIGVVLPKEGERRKKEKPEKLDAGKVRKLYEKDKKRAEKLREMFYRNDDVERYLGT
ncbi:G-patch domain-containing protein [Rutstroemia sp. NJR-2017a WRK4]|nr:G-patch domain-containing protein [Rutstroemia sp. NJR-2017a WRK4]